MIVGILFVCVLMALMEEDGDLILLYRDHETDIFRTVLGDHYFVSGTFYREIREGLHEEE